MILRYAAGPSTCDFRSGLLLRKCHPSQRHDLSWSLISDISVERSRHRKPRTLQFSTGCGHNLNTVHKCRRLESRRWEKKSSRFQLKNPSCSGEKKLDLRQKKTPIFALADSRTFALADSRSGVQFSLGRRMQPCQWHKLCPLLGVGVVASKGPPPRPLPYVLNGESSHPSSAGPRV